MTAIILTIISLIQIAAKYEPQAVEAYKNARQLFTLLFAGGLITVEQQKALNDWADAHEAAVLAGDEPPEFKVEAD